MFVLARAGLFVCSEIRSNRRPDRRRHAPVEGLPAAIQEVQVVGNFTPLAALSIIAATASGFDT